MTSDLAIPTPDMFLHRRIKHLEGALEIACAKYTDQERKTNLYKWLRETLRAPIQAKVVDVTQAQDPKMLEVKVP